MDLRYNILETVFGVKFNGDSEFFNDHETFYDVTIVSPFCEGVNTDDRFSALQINRLENNNYKLVFSGKYLENYDSDNNEDDDDIIDHDFKVIIIVDAETFRNKANQAFVDSIIKN